MSKQQRIAISNTVEMLGEGKSNKSQNEIITNTDNVMRRAPSTKTGQEKN